MNAYTKFADYYDLIYKGTVDYEKECEILETIFERYSPKKPKTILDVGCGTGSHTIPLAKQGYSVTGIDISPGMIKKAKEKAEKENVDAKFLVQDMRSLNLETKLDSAICMFGAFGYLLTNEDLARFFAGLSRNLDEAGLFVFEFWSIGGLKPSPYKSWTKAQHENVIVYRFSESNFDRETNVLNIDMHFIIVYKDKLPEIFAENHNIRCYTLAEMKKRLKNNGFKPVAAYDWDRKDAANLKAPRKETFRILMISRKKNGSIGH